MSDTLEVLDRWDGGISWTLADDAKERTCHALVVRDDGTAPGGDEESGSGNEEPEPGAEDESADGSTVWLVDPVDAPGLDDELAALGDVAGVVVLLDRHTRDAATLASRHGVPVYLPEALADVEEDVDAETTVFRGSLPGTDLRTITLRANRLWREVALYSRDTGTLVVPESVGTAAFIAADGERLGVHPALRLFPPKTKLGGLRPERILVGHGAGVFDDAPRALDRALRNARRNAPKLYVGTLSELLG